MSGTKIQKFVLRDRTASELRERGIIEAPKLASATSGARDRRTTIRSPVSPGRSANVEALERCRHSAVPIRAGARAHVRTTNADAIVPSNGGTSLGCCLDYLAGAFEDDLWDDARTRDTEQESQGLGNVGGPQHLIRWDRLLGEVGHVRVHEPRSKRD